MRTFFPGEDAELLKREIQAIEELLEEEAGSKCECVLSGYGVLIIRAKGVWSHWFTTRSCLFGVTTLRLVMKSVND